MSCREPAAGPMRADAPATTVATSLAGALRAARSDLKCCLLITCNYQTEGWKHVGPARTLLMIAACVTALPAAAQAPLPTTAFNGTYAGISAVSTRSQPGSHNGYCRQPAIPSPLTIWEGVIQPTGGDGWRGTVSPQGGLVIRDLGGRRVNAQIDPSGTITGSTRSDMQDHVRVAQAAWVNLSRGRRRSRRRRCARRAAPIAPPGGRKPGMRTVCRRMVPRPLTGTGTRAAHGPLALPPLGPHDHHVDLRLPHLEQTSLPAPLEDGRIGTDGGAPVRRDRARLGGGNPSTTR